MSVARASWARAAARLARGIQNASCDLTIRMLDGADVGLLLPTTTVAAWRTMGAVMAVLCALSPGGVSSGWRRAILLAGIARHVLYLPPGVTRSNNAAGDYNRRHHQARHYGAILFPYLLPASTATYLFELARAHPAGGMCSIRRNDYV